MDANAPAQCYLQDLPDKELTSVMTSRALKDEKYCQDDHNLLQSAVSSSSYLRCFVMPSGDHEQIPEVAPSALELPKSSSTRSRKKKKKAPGVQLTVDPNCLFASVKNSLHKPSKAESEAFQQVKDHYDRAIKFRDFYFDFFPIERAPRRSADVSEAVQKMLHKITVLGNMFKPRNLPWFFAYRALCLSIDPQRAKEAHSELRFAVRHLAHFPILWIALGESYWEQNDYYLAVACFEKAAMLDRTDVVPLVKLSCSMRLLLGNETDTTEKCKLVLKMVHLAKQAVIKCPDFGETWYNLGNALLVYFNIKGQAELVLESLEAFKKASACRILENKAEFHYNYATAHLLYGNYKEALKMWNRASAMEPDWASPKEKVNDLVKYLAFVSTLVSGKDRTFRRRVKQLAESVPVFPLKNINSISENELNINGTIPYKVASVRSLTEGLNVGVVAHGKIYATTYQTPDPSRLVFLIDASAEYIPVVIYNMGVEFSVGGSVSIPDPVIHCVSLSHDKTDIDFRYIRVDEPWRMFHNLIKVPRSLCAQTVVVTAPVPRTSSVTQ